MPSDCPHKAVEVVKCHANLPEYPGLFKYWGILMAISSHQTLLRLLRKLYPNPASELVFHGEYQLIVAVMLSAQCTDKKVNQVTPELFRRYPTFVELSQARLSDLLAILHPVNYYRTKARHLRAAARMVLSEFAGRLPLDRDELVRLAGVGQKTANVVLTELGAARTFPVDTHVFRVSKRLGLTSGKTPEKVEEDLMQIFKSQHWRNLHHWLIFHGRRVCKARKPECQSCGLSKICPAVGV